MKRILVLVIILLIAIVSVATVSSVEDQLEDLQIQVAQDRPSVCKSSSKSSSTLSENSPVKITITGSPPAGTSIMQFMLAFYNMDNLYGPSNPKPIYFGGKHFTKTVNKASNSHTFTVSYADLDKPDTNFNNQPPEKIQVNGYFFLNDGRMSAPEANCVQRFNIDRESQASCPTSICQTVADCPQCVGGSGELGCQAGSCCCDIFAEPTCPTSICQTVADCPQCVGGSGELGCQAGSCCCDIFAEPTCPDPYMCTSLEVCGPRCKDAYECGSGDCCCDTSDSYCTETDGGRKFDRKGATYKCTGDRPCDDRKTDSCSGDTLTEYYCDGKDRKSVEETCAACVDGACVSDGCHDVPLWDSDYCSSSCKCDKDEGDCDNNDECNTGYCAQDVGAIYGQRSGLDVCQDPEDLVVQCTDSDDGQNFFTKGIVTYTDSTGEHTKPDRCRDDFTLKEYFCDDDTYGRIEETCENGCQDGACLKLEPRCTDSDGGRRYGEKGTVTKGDEEYTDVCNSEEPFDDSYSEHAIKEMYCDNNDVASKKYECPNGCANGACLEPPLECSDSGSDYFERGKCEVGGTTKRDRCRSGTNILKEYLCTEGSCDSVEFDCDSLGDYYCDDGICKENEHRIQVIAPNGGETWNTGETRNFEWEHSRAPDIVHVNIHLIPTSFRCTQSPCPLYLSEQMPAYFYVIASDIHNDGLYEWVVGEDVNGRNVPSGNYYARILDYYHNYDDSDAPFAITSDMPSCHDSDGKNYFEKGTTSSCQPGSQESCVAAVDECDGDEVVEYYCANGITLEKYMCPNGCEDGACITDVACTDSDTGKNFGLKGLTKGIEESTYDYVEREDYCAEDKLVEYYCSDDKVKSEDVLCSNKAVFLIDNSGSMYDEIRAITTLVESISPESEITLLGDYLNSEMTECYLGGGRSGQDENWAGAAKYLCENNVIPVNGEFVQWPDDVEKIIFFSSDEDSCSCSNPAKEQYVSDAISACNDAGIKVYFLKPRRVGCSMETHAMRLASQTGGETFNIEDVSSIQSVLGAGYCQNGACVSSPEEPDFKVVDVFWYPEPEVGQNFTAFSVKIQNIGADFYNPLGVEVRITKDGDYFYEMGSSFSVQIDAGNYAIYDFRFLLTRIPEFTPGKYVVTVEIDEGNLVNEANDLNNFWDEEFELGPCIDSDGGKNYFERGVTKMLDQVQTDSCDWCTGACPPSGPCPPVECHAVKEYYCGINDLMWEIHSCPNGCQDGACIKEEPVCQVDEDCDDDNACTIETCANGVCEHTEAICPDGKTCDPQTGNCVMDECSSSSDCELGICPDKSTYQRYNCLDGKCVEIAFFKDPCSISCVVCDVNRDAVINYEDFTIIDNWIDNPGEYQQRLDTDSDGDIDSDDIEICEVNFVPGTRCGCQLVSASIEPNCDNCKQGDTISLQVTFNGECPGPLYLQVNAESTDCTISQQGDMEGINGQCSASGNCREWTIPNIPDHCTGEFEAGTATLYKGNEAIASTQAQGSFMLVGGSRCEDTDTNRKYPDGKNYFVQGTASYCPANQATCTAFEDYCVGKTLVEGYCDGEIKTKEYTCKQGCETGACILEGHYCGDGVCHGSEFKSCKDCAEINFPFEISNIIYKPRSNRGFVSRLLDFAFGRWKDVDFLSFTIKNKGMGTYNLADFTIATNPGNSKDYSYWNGVLSGYGVIGPKQEREIAVFGSRNQPSLMSVGNCNKKITVGIAEALRQSQPGRFYGLTNVYLKCEHVMFNIEEILGLKEFAPNEKVTLKIKGVEPDGTVGKPDEGFSMKYEIAGTTGNAVYQDNYWHAEFDAPSTVGEYLLILTYTCSENKECAQRYGLGTEVVERRRLIVRIYCLDSDNGKTHNVFGKVTGIDINGFEMDMEDICEGDEVHEYYCKDSTTQEPQNFGSENYNCTYGCIDGACRAEPLCTDTDGGLNYDERGVVSYYGLPDEWPDKCILPKYSEVFAVGDGVVHHKTVESCENPVPLREATLWDCTISGTEEVADCMGADCYLEETFCGYGGNTEDSVYYMCEYGCENGACMPEATCTDSDGVNYTVKGHIEYENNPQGILMEEDECDEDILQERICVDPYDSSKNVEVYECPDGCEDGACMQSNNESDFIIPDPPYYLVISGLISNESGNYTVNHEPLIFATQRRAVEPEETSEYAEFTLILKKEGDVIKQEKFVARECIDNSPGDYCAQHIFDRGHFVHAISNISTMPDELMIKLLDTVIYTLQAREEPFPKIPITEQERDNDFIIIKWDEPEDWEFNYFGLLTNSNFEYSLILFEGINADDSRMIENGTLRYQLTHAYFSGPDGNLTFKIYITDGFRTRVATTNTFNVGILDRGIYITEPEENQTYAWYVHLGAYSFHPKSGSWCSGCEYNNTFEWISSVDGFLSNKGTTSCMGLTPGEHLITLNQEHPDGYRVTDSVKIYVANHTGNIGPFC